MTDLNDYEGDPGADRERLSQLLTDQLEELAREIHSRDQLARARAASRLVALDVDPELALPALSHRRYTVREVAAEAIGYSQKPLTEAVIDALLAAIDDPKPFVAAAAIRALGRRQVMTAREQITACLDDPEPALVAAAIVALARLGDTTLALTLPDFLSSPHLTIRIAAAEAAGLLHTLAAVPGLLQLLSDCVSAWHETQPRIPSRAASIAMHALARLRARAAVPLLIEIARYVVGLRTLAVRALTQLQAVEAAPAIAPLLQEEGSHLLREVIRFLHIAGYRAAMPQLRRMLQQPEHYRRALLIQIMHVLAEWEDAASIPLMAQIASHHTNPDVRRCAERCLTRLQQVNGNPRALDADHPAHPPAMLVSEQLNQRLQQRRQRIASFAIDSVVEGVVLRVLSYGAVIDLGGVEGFVHVREIDWRWISDARTALYPGQAVQAVVIGIDEARLRVNLSMRRLTHDPWLEASQRFTVGMEVTGWVAGITRFGVFVELAPGVQGLAHTSQLPASPRPLAERFALGSEVTAVILAIDNERRRIALALRDQQSVAT